MSFTAPSSKTASAPAAGSPQSLWLAAMPFVFGVIWSTGFIVARFGLPYAPPLVGESMRGRQWTGLVFGLCGVGLVVANKISLIGLSSQSIAPCVFALLSITAGTLYRKRYCASFDLRTGTLIHRRRPSWRG